MDWQLQGFIRPRHASASQKPFSVFSMPARTKLSGKKLKRILPRLEFFFGFYFWFSTLTWDQRADIKHWRIILWYFDRETDANTRYCKLSIEKIGSSSKSFDYCCFQLLYKVCSNFMLSRTSVFRLRSQPFCKIFLFWEEVNIGRNKGIEHHLHAAWV